MIRRMVHKEMFEKILENMFEEFKKDMYVICNSLYMIQILFLLELATLLSVLRKT